jgi:hypothetical protein
MVHKTILHISLLSIVDFDGHWQNRVVVESSVTNIVILSYFGGSAIFSDIFTIFFYMLVLPTFSDISSMFQIFSFSYPRQYFQQHDVGNIG